MGMDLHVEVGRLIDWLVFNANFSNISAILWCEEILLLTKTPTRPLEIKHKMYLSIKQTDYIYK